MTIMVLSFCKEPIISLSEGNLYTSGEIGKVDHAKAAKYFTKAAEKGQFLIPGVPSRGLD